jgi:hypothetical protein
MPKGRLYSRRPERIARTLRGAPVFDGTAKVDFGLPRPLAVTEPQTVSGQVNAIDVDSKRRGKPLLVSSCEDSG